MVERLMKTLGEKDDTCELIDVVRQQGHSFRIPARNFLALVGWNTHTEFHAELVKDGYDRGFAPPVDHSGILARNDCLTTRVFGAAHRA